MSLGRRVALVGSVALLATGALTAATAPAGGANTSRLVAFNSCGDLLLYAKSHLSGFVGPWGVGFGGGIAGGMPGAVAAPAAGRVDSPKQGTDYSGTNVQEEGVDEPDIVKTNGKTLFAVAGEKLNAVDVRTPKPRLLDTIKLADGWSQELLLHGDRLLVLSRGGYWMTPLPGLAARIFPWAPAQSVLTEVDVSDPKALRVVRTLTLDGSYVAARLVGSTARIVAASPMPGPLPFEPPADATTAARAAALERNRAIVASSGVVKWLPSYRIARPGRAAGKGRPLVQCRHVLRPKSFSGLGLLTVLTVDLDKGLTPLDSEAVLSDGRIVYASPDSLYVATERWADRPDPAAPAQPKNGVVTAIHSFDISSPLRTRYRGSGSVAGFLLSQWSLSESRGVLRVVSTESPAWWGGGAETESFLTTLRPRDGSLAQVGRIGNLGRGERVYAVRFVDDVGYVVTFRQVDPLYTVDLADPERPRVLGELKISGYSAYLHPIGKDLLLGIGQDVSEQGRPLGTQLSLFDVSDLRHPKRLYHAALGAGWSEAESDHHAFLFWPRTALVVVPFAQGALGFHVGRATGIDAAGRIEHNATQSGIRRSLVAGGGLLTVSEAGVEASSLTSLAPLGWAAFPPADPPPPSP